ncbi:GPW/gp25 family protein [cf. Phormidesmis sp. LEGE 11477]|uniref:GPW/gp25 family protein n=1 Tax=cf. Phormidesmis sp. LEGE 11477 TaxID=1828680 RepID=UPI00351DA5F9
MRDRNSTSLNNLALANPALISPTGWPLLPLPDEQGQMHYPSLSDSVRQSIEIILRTRPGEQLMRPGFGAGLENFLQQPNNLTTRRRIQGAITESLNLWEKRILLHRVDIEEVPNQPTHLRIEIVYQIKRSGQIQQLGLTMEMEG